jgi:L-ascorbate metabolism protein UlaG (beta-lactamase superfamily)
MMTARLDWYGCATFRLTVGSLVLFLDAYIDRIPGAAGTGLRADDIERADWIDTHSSFSFSLSWSAPPTRLIFPDRAHHAIRAGLFALWAAPR